MPSKPPKSSTGRGSGPSAGSGPRPHSPEKSPDVATGTPNRDWTELLSALASSDVRFLLVGGYAVCHHAEPRFTADLDLFYDPSAENAERLREALESWAGPAAVATLNLHSPRTAIFIGVEPWRVDLLNFVDGISFEQAWPRRETTRYGGVELPVVDLETLIEAKSALLERDRPPRKKLQDQADLAALQEVAARLASTT